MAGSHKLARNGVEISVRPDFWLRRLMPFQVYLDRTNPVFRVTIKRVPGEPLTWEESSFRFAVSLGDGKKESGPVVVRFDFESSDSHEFRLPVFAAMIGWTEIWVLLPGTTRHETLYTYPVRAEDAVGWGLGSILLAVATAAVAKFLLG